MLKIDATKMDFTMLNAGIRQSLSKNIVIDNCMGQRYIGCAAADMTIEINGTPVTLSGVILTARRFASTATRRMRRRHYERW
jgi:hypothetical protein